MKISPEYSLERLMLKLKLQYLGHLMWRADSLEKTLMLGKIEGRRRSKDRELDGWVASSTQWRWVWAGSRSWWCTGKPGVLQSMGSQRVRQHGMTELNWNFLTKKTLRYQWENSESEKLALKVLESQRALESRDTIYIHLYIIICTYLALVLLATGTFPIARW